MFHGEEKIEAMSRVSEFRDQVFKESEGQVVKVVGGAVVGMYILYKFLIK